MGSVIAFAGVCGGCGVSQAAQCAAEMLARDFGSGKVLLFFAQGRQGDDYCEGIKMNAKTLIPYMSGSLINADETAEKSFYRENLHIMGGDGSPGSREDYYPSMAEYMLGVLKDSFSFIICDCGFDTEHGLSLGALMAADEVYMVLNQREVTLRRASETLRLWGELGLAPAGVAMQAYEKGRPQDEAYVRRVLPQCPDNFFRLRKSAFSAEAEIERKSLLSFKEKGFAKDVAKLCSAITGKASGRGLLKRWQ